MATASLVHKPAGTKHSQRIVPSGKVYRQLFDAEVQLVKSLDKSRSEAANRTLQPRSSKLRSLSPVAHPAVTDPGGCGMLTDRQLTWLEEFPNVSTTENPVLYKFFADESKERLGRQTAEHLPKAEVQGLPDVIEPAKVGSDILDRVTTSRRLRHDAALDDMHHELGLISNELEPLIESHSQQLLESLDCNNTETVSLLANLDSDERLMEYSMAELEALWQTVTSHCKVRQRWISELDDRLTTLESERVDKMRSLFERTWTTLEKIAYMSVPDLQRMLDKECQLINQIVLNNKRMYADLKSRLLLNDVNRNRKLYVQWHKRVETWKQIQRDLAIENFKSFMASDTVLNNAEVAHTFELMAEKQNQLNEKRIDLINNLLKVGPPTLCPQYVTDWYQQILDISKSIDEVNQKYFNELCLQYETVCQFCLGELNRVKDELIERCVCTEAEVSELVTKQCLSFIGTQQAAFEKSLETLDHSIESTATRSLKLLKSLYKHLQLIANVWDVHETNISRHERDLNDKLDKLRLQHDVLNQDRESSLDVIVDSLRQGATEAVLKEDLRKALQLLDTIRLGYDEFFDQQSAVVAEYPDVIQKELAVYSESVCNFFQLKRIQQKSDNASPRMSPRASPVGSSSALSTKSGVTASSQQKLGPETIQTDSGAIYLVMKSIQALTNSQTSQISTGSQVPAASQVSTGSQVPAASLVSTGRQVPAASQVSTVTGSEAVPSTDTIMTESHPDDVIDDITAIAIDESLVVAVKKAMRFNAVNHLEFWSQESVYRARLVVDAKIGELRSELELRLHLHEPRARRVELDIHNVRSAELLLHSERVSRHINGLEQVLTELTDAIDAMTEDHTQKIDRFKADLERLEKLFVDANKTSRLNELSSQLATMQKDLTADVHLSIEQFREHLAHTLKTLRESTARLISSFKLFADGGNFCAAEVAEYTKRIEKTTQKFDGLEQTLANELKGIEPKRMEQSMKLIRDFDEKYKVDMVDLAFVEKVARWLTNTQVKIKSEVAESNQQSQQIAGALLELEHCIVSCEKPGPDTGYGKPSEIIELLMPLFELLKNRSVYLKCLGRPSTDAPEPPPAVPSDSQPPAAKQGKKHSAGPQARKTSATGKHSAGAQPTGTTSPTGKPATGKAPQPVATKGGTLTKAGTPHTVPESVEVPNNAETPVQPQPWDSVPPISQPGGKAPADDASVVTIRQILKSQKVRNADCDGLSSVPSVDSLTKIASMSNVQSKKSSSKGQQSTKEKDKKQGKSGKTGGSKNKIDPKNFVFGSESDDETEQTHFNGRVKAIVRATQTALLTYAEQYYKQKGQRPVTRPTLMQDNLEECADTITQKLLSYTAQTDEFYNNCLQEFREQLKAFEMLCSRVPRCVIQEILQTALKQTEQQDKQAEFNNELTQLIADKEANDRSLRPNLGHPAQATVLAELCLKEEDRHNRTLEVISLNTDTLIELKLLKCREFVDGLTESTEQLLLLFDNVLVVDDIITGQVNPVRLSLAELIVQKKTCSTIDCQQTEIQRGPNTWPGLTITDLFKQPQLSKPSEIFALTSTPPNVTSTTTAAAAAGGGDGDTRKEDNVISVVDAASKQQLKQGSAMSAIASGVDLKPSKADVASASVHKKQGSTTSILKQGSTASVMTTDSTVRATGSAHSKHGHTVSLSEANIAAGSNHKQLASIASKSDTSIVPVPDGTVDAAKDELQPTSSKLTTTASKRSVNKSSTSLKQPSLTEEVLTPSVTTAKTTLAHQATIVARDLAFQDYKKYFESTIADIVSTHRQLLTDEFRWLQRWTTSVNNIKQLY